MSKRKVPADTSESSRKSARGTFDNKNQERREVATGSSGNRPVQRGGGSGRGSYDKAVVQILLACGTVDSKTFEGLLARIKGDFDDAHVDSPLEDTFKRINNSIRKFSLEVRSVRLKNDEGVWVIYYGLVNNEDDFVAKQNGMLGTFDEAELRFFSTKLLPKIVSSRYLTTGEVSELVSKNGGLTKSKVHDLLNRLRSSLWLSSSDRGFWELGPRTYLELRSNVEGIMQNGLDDSLSQEERQAQLTELKETLPQVIYF